jgi:acylphosphatase
MANRVRIRVRGRVQGVSFRAATRDEAQSRGLTGWVRNDPDGSVLLEAQGDPAQVAALQAWCAHGPPAARVTGLEPEAIDPLASEQHFEIRRG